MHSLRAQVQKALDQLAAKSAARERELLRRIEILQLELRARTLTGDPVADYVSF